MYNNKSTQDKWMRIKKFFAIVVAVGLWVASMNFSYSGFKFNIPELAWLGWVLAIAVTVIELVFNTDIQKLNLTLFFAGILSYIYGIYTNVIGIFVAQSGTWDLLKTNPLSIVFPLLVGLFIEVVPEPLFVWGIGANDKGDPIGNLLRGKEKVEDWTEYQYPTHKIQSEFIGKIPKKKENGQDDIGRILQ